MRGSRRSVSGWNTRLIFSPRLQKFGVCEAVTIELIMRLSVILLDVSKKVFSMEAIHGLLHDDIRAVAGSDEQRLFNEPHHFS